MFAIGLRVVVVLGQDQIWRFVINISHLSEHAAMRDEKLKIKTRQCLEYAKRITANFAENRGKIRRKLKIDFVKKKNNNGRQASRQCRGSNLR